MKQCKHVIIVFFCLILFPLYGCTALSFSNLHTDDVSPIKSLLNKGDNDRFTIQMDMFIGELPAVTSNLQEIPCLTENGHCIYWGQTFDEVPYQDGLSFPDHCVWQLDCNYLEPLGKMSNGNIVYGVQNEGGVIASLLLVSTDSEHPGVSWFVSDDLDILDPCAYRLTDFEIEIISGPNDGEDVLWRVWSYHIGEQYTDTLDVLVEDPEWRKLFLISKENPWLVYELNYFCIDANIFINNVPNDGMVAINPAGYSAYPQS